jgi:hypothetical protein
MIRIDFLKKFNKIAENTFQGSGIKQKFIGNSWVIYSLNCFHFDLILEFVIEPDLNSQGYPDQFYFSLESKFYWEHECEYGYNMSFGKSACIPLICF